MKAMDAPRLSRRQRLAVILIALLLAVWIGLAASERLRARFAPAPPPVTAPTAVEVMELREEPWVVTRRYRGRLEAERRAVVAARLTAPVVEVLHWEGARVAEGTPLVRLDRSEAEREVERLEAIGERVAGELALARQERSRQEALYERELIPERLLDEARQRVQALAAQQRENRAALALAQTRLGYAEARAPFAGVLQRIHVRPGELAGAGQPLVELLATDSLKAIIAVPQAEAALLEAGRPVELAVPALGEATWSSVLSRVRPALAPGTLNATVEAFLPASGAPLRPGMAVEAHIEVERGRGIAVPAHAVRHDAGGAWVLIAEAGIARRRAVEPGPTRDGMTWIRSGLAPGVRLIATPDPRLADGAPIAVVERAGTR